MASILPLIPTAASRKKPQVQYMQKGLIQMNVQLPLVVSGIDGETGLRVIEAILQGERDSERLVKLRDRTAIL